ncbi:MAG TPA: diacylglycerol kinase family protein [Solirubrobacteraceae bacterium]
MSREICLIVNPSAGGGRAGRAAPAVEQRLRGLGLNVQLQLTQSLQHAKQIAGEAAAAEQVLVCLSGDGLIGAVADVARHRKGALLGVLPGGRGNDLARVLDIPDDPLLACETIATGISVPLDLGEVFELPHPDASLSPDQMMHGKAFVGIASVGFDSDANRIANEAPRQLGGLVYVYGALGALLAWKPASFSLTLDGQRSEVTGYSIGACNSQAYGGGMYVAPQARLDDGLLDVVSLGQISKLRFVTRILPRVFKGTHGEEPTVQMSRGQQLHIAADRDFHVYADGDPIGRLPVLIRALPKAVNVLVPQQTATSWRA